MISPKEIYIGFTYIDEYFDPEIINKFLRADDFIKKGDMHGVIKPARFGRWTLTTRNLSLGQDIEVHLANLLERAAPVSQQLNQIREDYDLNPVFRGCLYIEEASETVMVIHAPYLQKAVYYGAGFDLDTYVDKTSTHDYDLTFQALETLCEVWILHPDSTAIDQLKTSMSKLQPLEAPHPYSQDLALPLCGLNLRRYNRWAGHLGSEWTPELDINEEVLIAELLELLEPYREQIIQNFQVEFVIRQSSINTNPGVGLSTELIKQLLPYHPTVRICYENCIFK